MTDATDEVVTGALRLFGQVVDESDRPVPGARVWLMPGYRVVTSDAEGAFAFEGLAAREFELRAKLDDLYSGPIDVALTETTASEPQTVRVKRGATLIVHVVGEREPLVGARVTLGTQPDPEGIWTERTDATGTAVHRGLQDHPYTIRIAADGWATTTTGAFPRAEDPAAIIELDVVLKRGARVEGRVIGPDDKPVPDATVDIGDMGNFRAQVNEATTDANGVWYFDAIPSGTYSLTAGSKTFARSADVVVELDGVTPHTGIVLRVLQGGQLRGRVVDQKGNPIADAEVDAEIEGESGERGRTADDGRFELLGLRPAKYLVRGRKGRLASASTNIVLDHGIKREVTLVVEDTAIAGTVVDSKGKPLTNVGVHASSKDFYWPYWEKPKVTDKDGHFELTGLEPGEFRVTASRLDEKRLPSPPEAQPQPEGVLAHTGDSNVKLVLSTWGTITGRVVFNGAPMPYYGMMLGEPNFWRLGATPIAVRATDGRFTFPNVEPGTWELQILGPGTGLRRVEHITVREGQALDLGDIVMSRGQRITGHVSDTAGRPIAGARVMIDGNLDFGETTQLARWFAGEHSTVSDATGAYVLDGIQAAHGRAIVPRIGATHLQHGSSPVRELPTGDVTIDFTLAAVGSIDGFIDGFQGFLFIEARRTHDPEPLRSHIAYANRLGRFALEDLPVGEYDILPDADGGSTVTPAKVTVQANQRVPVKLTMTAPYVKVTINVPWGKHDSVAFVEVKSDGRERPMSPRVIMENRVVFEGVVPGAYKASLDAKTWKQIVITEKPAEQTVDLDGK